MWAWRVAAGYKLLVDGDKNSRRAILQQLGLLAPAGALLEEVVLLVRGRVAHGLFDSGHQNRLPGLDRPLSTRRVRRVQREVRKDAHLEGEYLIRMGARPSQIRMDARLSQIGTPAFRITSTEH